MTGRSFHKTILMRALLASLLLACGWTAPARAAEILTIELEAVFTELEPAFDGDAPDSLDIEVGDTLSFSAVLTDLENTGDIYGFAPTILKATAKISGAHFTFGNVRASTFADSHLRFDLFGDTDFSDGADYEFTGSGPLIEGGTFSELSLLSDQTDPSPISSLAELIPHIRSDLINLVFLYSVMATGPDSWTSSGGVVTFAEITSLEFTLTAMEVVPLPAAFPLMAGGLALFGGAGFARRRRRGR